MKTVVPISALLIACLGCGYGYKRFRSSDTTVPIPVKGKLSTELITESSRQLVHLMNKTKSRYGYFDDSGRGFHTIESLEALVNKITTEQSDVYEFVGPNDRCTLHIDYETVLPDKLETATKMLDSLLAKLKQDFEEGDKPLKIITLTASRQGRISYHVHVNRIFKNLKVMKYYLLEHGYDKEPFSEFIDWNIYKHRYGRLFRCLNQYKKFEGVTEVDPNSVLRPLYPDQKFKPIETLVKYLDEASEIVYDMYDDQLC